MSDSRLTEWPATLDMQGLLGSGWRPTPFNEFILKVYSRCNLSCDYCYMFMMADQGWRSQPLRMSSETIDHSVRRIAEHAATHGLDQISLILHGGEPLLAGQDALAQIVQRLRAVLRDSTALTVILQTNGTRLTIERLRLLAELGIQVAVSLDGTAADHDRHRRRPDGRGSYAEVVRGLTLLSRVPFRAMFRGLLCTIDLRSDPVETFNALQQFRPPAIDFLLPHGNWSQPPPGLTTAGSHTPYAVWLMSIFDDWYGAPVQQIRIRTFEQIMQALLTGRAEIEGLGLAPFRAVVIETDGSIEQSDSLKSAYEGAAATGLNVRDHPLDAALALPPLAARQIGIGGLSAECRRCRVHRVCGAGQYAHRYRAGSGFLNPSVYCADLFQLITYIEDRLIADVVRIRTLCLTGT